MKNSFLEVRDVVKYYGRGSVVTKALDGVSFTMERGEFTAIMGASGSGKSTLLNVISTIDTISSGEIILDGIRVADQKEEQLSAFRRDKLGFVFQEYNLLDTLTVGENIMLPLNLQKISAAETKSCLRRVAGELGVEDQLDKFPYELSGGQRQRAACARAIITSPAIVLADEPTGALDSATGREVLETFVELNSLGNTIIMITHDEKVAAYAKRVVRIVDGRLFQ